MADFTPVVTARGLTKSFVGADGEHIDALSDLTLSMPPNVIVSLVGVDGAGKTTFMRHITGLMKADSGELSVLGINPATDSQAVQDRISYMPQAFGLYEDLSVRTSTSTPISMGCRNRSGKSVTRSFSRWRISRGTSTARPGNFQAA